MSSQPALSTRATAEAVGTFWLVFGGCGAAVFAAPQIGFLGVSLAFGLTVLTMAYAIGHISGCHLNPAVSIGLTAAGRFPGAELPAYIGAQVVGGLVAAGLLYVIATGAPGFVMEANSLAVNGFDTLSPGGYGIVSALIGEVVLTLMFLVIILGATDKRAPAGFAPIAIGLGLTLIHLIGIPLTNLSVNPARSTGPAVLVAVFGGGTTALTQVWLFWIAPIIGAAAAGFVYPMISGGKDAAS